MLDLPVFKNVYNQMFGINTDEFTLKGDSNTNLLKSSKNTSKDALSSVIGIQRLRNKEKVVPALTANQFEKYNETRFRVQQSLENQRKLIDEKEMQGVTFHPEINYNSSKLAQVGDDYNVLVRTENWAHSKNEKRKLAVQAKLVKEEKEDALAVSPMRLRDMSVEAISETKLETEGFQTADGSKSGFFFNKGNYKSEGQSRLQRKMRNWQSRKMSNDKEDNLKESKEKKVKVNFEDFRTAVHHKINKN